MKSSLQIGERKFLIDLSRPIDVSIPLQFNGPQPNAYGVAKAVSEPIKAGDLVGDTRLGGSVNFEQYTFIPHCNGTHTECVGHITNERISVRDCLKDVFIPAVLVSVEPEGIDGEVVVTRESIERAINDNAEARALAMAKPGTELIVRTLPNDDSKLTRQYGKENIPPYFSTEAMEYIVELGVKHLVADMPSIDRIFDDGNLLNHRIFWNVKLRSFEVNENTRINSTITEMIYVPNEVPDGEYLLNLQIAPFESDCAPSRPVLFTT